MSTVYDPDRSCFAMVGQPFGGLLFVSSRTLLPCEVAICVFVVPSNLISPLHSSDLIHKPLHHASIAPPTAPVPFDIVSYTIFGVAASSGVVPEDNVVSQTWCASFLPLFLQLDVSIYSQLPACCLDHDLPPRRVSYVAACKWPSSCHYQSIHSYTGH